MIKKTQQLLEEKIDESIVSVFEVLRKRIDKFGVTHQTFNVLNFR